METLDKCFENVCELDLIFHVDKVGNTFESVFFLFNRTCLKYAYNIPFTSGNQKWVPLIFSSSSSCFSQVHNILAEMVMGGMVLETNMNEIITQVDAQNKMEKSEVSLTCPPTVCMTWFYLHTFWGTRHSMQACVYAAPCMRLSGDLVDAPDLLFECLCSFFSASSLCRCTAPNAGPQYISCFTPHYNVLYCRHHFCHIMEI